MVITVVLPLIALVRFHVSGYFKENPPPEYDLVGICEV